MIRTIEIFLISLKSLNDNKMRSLLTMLGMVIGVASVIAMLAIGTGATRKFEIEVANGGSNLLTVMPGNLKQRGVSLSSTDSTLTINDSQAIAKECPSVLCTAPVTRDGVLAVYGNNNWSTSVHATTPDILTVRNAKIVTGRNLMEQDVRNATKVCVLGQTVVTNLFGGDNPIGKIIRIKKIPFKVIGVKEIKGQSWEGNDLDDVILIPTTTAQKRLFSGAIPGVVGWINIKATSEHNLTKAEGEISALLRQRHHINPGKDDDFRVRNSTQMLKMSTEINKVMTKFLGAIASISLLVGGIGIMNIMLVSVSERTREIGIRMAIGAKAFDIRFQFLTEALILSFIGGTIGIAVGIISAWSISIVAEWPIVVSLWSILLSIGFSVTVGVSFGYYPAWKASLLDPVEALRGES